MTGRDEESWMLDAALSTASFWDRLILQYPDLQKHKTSIRLAKNYEYVLGETTFHNPDEVALIPPVSGG